MNVHAPRALLLALLRGTHDPASLSPAEWSAVVAAARATNLLGSLGEKLGGAGIGTGCGADRHLAGARQLSERQRRSVRWEAQCLHDALSGLDIPVVLLKGAAYALGGHANARGRLFGDIDILVPPESLGAVELRLMMHGWASTVSDAYDQRYYRTWMHELPPMVHVRRGSVLDVHHTILPPTARHRPDARRIVERSTPHPELPALRVPCIEDLVVHSVTHLVHEGEPDNGLRDLYDIHCLIASRKDDAGFPTRLAACVREHGLDEPVALGLRLAQRHFGTPLPPALPTADGGAGTADRLYEIALRPDAHGAAAVQLAGAALYVRAHWLRMPPLLLARHLARKAFMRAFAAERRTAGEAERVDDALPR